MLISISLFCCYFSLNTYPYQDDVECLIYSSDFELSTTIVFYCLVLFCFLWIQFDTNLYILMKIVKITEYRVLYFSIHVDKIRFANTK